MSLHHPALAHWCQRLCGGRKNKWSTSSETLSLSPSSFPLVFTQSKFHFLKDQPEILLHSRKKMLDWQTPPGFFPWNENKFTFVLCISFLYTLASSYVHILLGKTERSDGKRNSSCLFHIFGIKKCSKIYWKKKIYSLGIEMLQTLHSVRNYGELKENNARTNRL